MRFTHTIKLVKTSFLTVLLSACGSMSVQEISSNEVPQDLWDGEGEVYVSSFRLDDPTVQKVRRPGDCPGQTIARGDPRAMCVEKRVRDPERQCNVVASTYGIGYCPPSYSYQNAQNASSMQQMDAVMSAGTAAQNAVLAWGERMALDAQVKSRKLVEENRPSVELGSASTTDNFKEVTETVVPNAPLYQPLQIVARTRTGFYSECMIPKFEHLGLYSLGEQYYRILEDEITCKLEEDANFAPGYFNIRANNKEKTSYVGLLSVKSKDEAFDICITDPIMGMCAFKKTNVTSPSQFDLVRGFVEKQGLSRVLVSVDEFDETSVSLKVSESKEGYVVSESIVSIPADGTTTDVRGLSVSILGVSQNGIEMSVKGALNI